MKIYVFTEYNSWEGERWSFFIGMTEKQYNFLKDLIQDVSDFFISKYSYSKQFIKRIIEDASPGYYNSHNDFGYLTDDIFFVTKENVEDLLYKGGIGKYTTGTLL